MFALIGNVNTLAAERRIATEGPPETVAQKGEALVVMAQERFGVALSAAERKMLEGAPDRMIPWVGPDTDPNNPANDAGRGDKWGPDRTIRAELLKWLCTDPAALQYVHESGPSLAAARIAGKLDLSYLRGPKPITLLRCYAPDGFDISYAQLTSFEVKRSKIGPINGDMVTSAGDVAFMRGSYGPVSLFRARIGNNLNFSGGNFVAGAAEAAVSLVDANIAGDVLFLEGFKTDGFVDMRLAKVGDSVTFKNVQFVGGGDNGLNAERVAIEGTLYWFSVAVTARTVLDLENASAGALWDDSSSWPAKGNLVIDGFAYNDFSGGPSDAAGRLKWLALQPVGYHPRPYRRVAKVLRDDGREAEANTVEIAKEVEHRRFGEMSLLERAWNLLLQATIGYGFRPLRALWWIIGFVLLGTALFAWGYSAKVMTPTDETAYREFMKSGLTPPHYPPFNPLVYSLENFLPVVDLYQGSYWRPNPRDLPGGELHMGSLTSDARTFPGAMLRGYLWIHILAGWILTPLLFAGLSGLVRIE